MVSDVFKVIRSSSQSQGAATGKARLPKLRLVLGKISCCEINYLSFPGIDRARYVRVDSVQFIDSKPV